MTTSELGWRQIGYDYESMKATRASLAEDPISYVNYAVPNKN
jgi:hypothetical protein